MVKQTNEKKRGGRTLLSIALAAVFVVAAFAIISADNSSDPSADEEAYLGASHSVTGSTELSSLVLNDGDIINLTGNVTCTQPFTVTKNNIKLNLNGKTLTFNLSGTNYNAIEVTSGNNFELNGGTGGLLAVSGNQVRGISTGSDGKTITVNCDINVTSTSTSSSQWAAGVLITGNSEITVKGNITVTGNYGRGISASGNAKVTATGNITCTANACEGIRAYDDATVIITKGNISVTGDNCRGIYAYGNGVGNRGATVNVTGNITLAGNGAGDGIFASDMAKVTVSGNITLTGNGNGTGIWAVASPEISVGGSISVTGANCQGVYMEGGTVNISRNVTVSGNDCRGLNVMNDIVALVVGGKVTVSGTESIGVRFTGKADITVNGKLTVSGTDHEYVYLSLGLLADPVHFPPTEPVKDGDYWVYTHEDSDAILRVKESSDGGLSTMMIVIIAVVAIGAIAAAVWFFFLRK